MLAAPKPKNIYTEPWRGYLSPAQDKRLRDCMQLEFIEPSKQSEAVRSALMAFCDFTEAKHK